MSCCQSPPELLLLVCVKMEKTNHTFRHTYPDYVDEINTPCKVYSVMGSATGCEAIWDTGAEHTVISKDVAKKLNLRIVSKTRMYHAGGDTIVNTYNVFIGFNDDMIIGPINVLEGQFEGNAILLGMDVIGSGDLVVTNNEEHTEMAFTIPSTLKIDEIEKIM